MPIWLQLAAAVCAALASGIMGAALVPFLTKMRLCEPPQSPPEDGEAAGNRLRPTMGGLLTVFGSMTGLGLSYALYRLFCTLDGTSLSVQQDTREILLAVGYALLCAGAGFAWDLRIVRRKIIPVYPKLLPFLAVFLLTALFLLLCGNDVTVLDFGFWKYNAGLLFIPLLSLAGAVLWTAASAIEEETDGVSVSAGGVFLLGAAVLFLQENRAMHALLALTAAGACMGTLVWNLHPAKCRLGRTGSFWMAGAVTAVSLLHGQHMALLLTMAVYLLNRIPAWRKGGVTLQAQLRCDGVRPWKQIAVFAGFAAFCSILAAAG